MRIFLKLFIVSLLIPFSSAAQVKLSADEILEKVDTNMSSNSTITKSKMVIHGRRNTREVVSKAYAVGNQKAFTEYLAPAREEGTKMLKVEDKLWIYNPSTDRTIQLSGHMLRQSVMGSDLSYEDLMEDRALKDIYQAKIIDEETIDNRKCWILELNATVDDPSYQTRKTWIDQERFVPLKEELYAKSGQLLKEITMKNVEKIEDRWYPKSVNYKDVLKEGEGTDFLVLSIQFNPEIPEYIFNKASLKR